MPIVMIGAAIVIFTSWLKTGLALIVLGILAAEATGGVTEWRAHGKESK